MATRKQAAVIWSADVDDYAVGKKTVAQIRCVLCQHAPCDCPEFGSPAYFALINRRHGRNR
jgi:hypothetical protein